MLNKLKIKIKKNTEILALILLVIITIISTSYYNYNKKKIYNNFKNTINNIYLKKTITHLFDNLEPKYKKIYHKVSSGETFNSILEQYSINKKEILEIKDKLSNKVNLNKLNTNQKIQLTLDQSTDIVKDFLFQISNTEKIYLTRKNEKHEFNQKILITKLEKKIVYGENKIIQSLYKSALDKSIPPSTIIEFAQIYGFQVDFQRDIRKQDSFQIMYEIFIDDNGKIIETGNVLFANLKLSGQDNSLYYFDKKIVRDITTKTVKVLRKH